MPRIALILPDVVQEAGIRALLERYFTSVEVESFAETAGAAREVAATGTPFDGYVTDSGTFAANVDFFLPRRAQCLILTAGRRAMADAAKESGETPRTIGTAEPLENLLDAIGQTLLPLPGAEESNPSDELSAREVQVLQLVVSGAINKEIADRLNISLNTVLTHRKNITAKLGIKTISGLTLYALMHGYISTDTITTL